MTNYSKLVISKENEDDVVLGMVKEGAKLMMLSAGKMGDGDGAVEEPVMCLVLTNAVEVQDENGRNVGIGKLVKFKDIDGFDSHLPSIREIVMQQYASKNVEEIFGHGVEKPGGNSVNKCSVPGYKQELIRKAELLIAEEPKKPWITLKRIYRTLSAK